MRLLLIVAMIASVAAAKVEKLGEPCRARNVLAGRVVTDGQGRERLVLTNMNEATGAELIFVDFANNTAEVITAPAGTGSWALDEVPGKRLVVGTFYDGKFMVFDLSTMKFIHTSSFPGEQYIWNQALGSDGRLYGGTYPGAKLGALDLKTYAVEDLGAPAKPNEYLRNVSALPDGRILCQFGMENNTTLIFDPKTKKFSPVPDSIKGVLIGATWNGYFVAGSAAYHGSELARVKPDPFPTPKGGHWAVETYITNEKTLYIQQNDSVFRYTAGDKDLSLVTNHMIKGARLLAGTSTGELLGVRGQDYFVITPGKDEIALKQIPGPSAPREILFLEIDHKNRLWGGPTFGQTLFSMDTKTHEVKNTSQVANAGGEVYDATFLNGKVYAVSYSGGEIVKYDPEAPWDQIDGKNPHTIANLNERGYIRPIAGIVVGPDQKLYSGWMAKYGTYGGAIAITDPTDGKTDLIENPLGNQAIAGVAVDDKSIYFGTSLSANGLPNNKEGSAGFGVIDLNSHKVTFKKIYTGAQSVDHVEFDSKTHKVAFTVSNAWKMFDPATQEVTPIAGVPPVQSIGARAHDGFVYYGSGDEVEKLDLATATSTTLATLPAVVHAVAVADDGEVFAACGTDVYRVSGGGQ